MVNLPTRTSDRASTISTFMTGMVNDVVGRFLLKENIVGRISQYKQVPLVFICPMLGCPNAWHHLFYYRGKVNLTFFKSPNQSPCSIWHNGLYLYYGFKADWITFFFLLVIVIDIPIYAHTFLVWKFFMCSARFQHIVLHDIDKLV